MARIGPLAATKPKDAGDPDWIVGVKMPKDRDGLFYVEHIDRFRHPTHCAPPSMRTNMAT